MNDSSHLSPLGSTSLPAAATGLDIAQMVDQLLRQGERRIYRKIELAVDRAVLDAVLRYVKGNQVNASQLLGISRTTLRAKLRRLGVAVEKQLTLESNPID